MVRKVKRKKSGIRIFAALLFKVGIGISAVGNLFPTTAKDVKRMLPQKTHKRSHSTLIVKGERF